MRLRPQFSLGVLLAFVIGYGAGGVTIRYVLLRSRPTDADWRAVDMVRQLDEACDSGSEREAFARLVRTPFPYTVILYDGQLNKVAWRRRRDTTIRILVIKLPFGECNISAFHMMQDQGNLEMLCLP